MLGSKLSKSVGAGLFAVAMIAASANEGQAQIFVSGFTNGLFCAAGPACVNPNTSAIQTTSILGTGAAHNGQRLYYSNSQFSGNVSNGGSVAFNASAAPFKHLPTGHVTTQNINNFGAFYLGGGSVSFSSPFTLWVNFVNPTTGTLAFAGQVSGSIVSAHGTVQIQFAPNQQGFTYQSNGNWATITVDINDPNCPATVCVPGEGSSQITGVLSAHVTPEPVTMSLLGTGLLGLAGAARRRRRKNND